MKLLAALPAPAELVDHAARQSDRWLFLAMLTIVIGGALLVIRYLVRRDEIERQRLHESYDKNTSVARDLAVTLAANTAALERNSGLHERTVHALREVEERLRSR